MLSAKNTNNVIYNFALLAQFENVVVMQNNFFYAHHKQKFNL